MDEGEKKMRRRWVPWVFGAVALCAVLVGAVWLLVGRKVWTDGGKVRVADRDTRIREVLWTRPQPLGDEFKGEEQFYEPSISPDGTELYFVKGKAGKNSDIYVSYRKNNQ